MNTSVFCLLFLLEPKYVSLQQHSLLPTILRLLGNNAKKEASYV